MTEDHFPDGVLPSAADGQMYTAIVCCQPEAVMTSSNNILIKPLEVCPTSGGQFKPGAIQNSSLNSRLSDIEY